MRARQQLQRKALPSFHALRNPELGWSEQGQGGEEDWSQRSLGREGLGRRTASEASALLSQRSHSRTNSGVPLLQQVPEPFACRAHIHQAPGNGMHSSQDTDFALRCALLEVGKGERRGETDHFMMSALAVQPQPNQQRRASSAAGARTPLGGVAWGEPIWGGGGGGIATCPPDGHVSGLVPSC